MDFRQISTFLEVAKLESFSKAAEKMYITQPTVTSQIQKLEQELETTLFDRSGRRVVLTRTGEIFYKYAKEMVDLRNYASREISQFRAAAYDTVVIGVCGGALEYILPDLVHEFIKLEPSVRFEILRASSADIVSQIKNGFCNFGIIDEKRYDGGINQTQLMYGETVLAVPKKLASGLRPFETIPLSVLKSIPLIIKRDDDILGSLSDCLSEGGMFLSDLYVSVWAAANDPIKGLTLRGIGAGFFSIEEIDNEIKSGELVPVYVKNLQYSRRFYFLSGKKMSVTKACVKFYDFVTQMNESALT